MVYYSELIDIKHCSGAVLGTSSTVTVGFNRVTIVSRGDAADVDHN